MSEQFFQVVDVATFRSLLERFPPVSRTETVELSQACGRIAASHILAEEHLPPFNRSCMDGYAVRAADTFGASENSPAYLDLLGQSPIDRIPDLVLNAGQCAGVVTGSFLPSGADGVVMVEHCRLLGEDMLEVGRSIAPGENVLYQGEDCEPGDTAVSAGAVLDSPRISLLAGLGIASATVYHRPRVALIATGDELVPVEQTPHQAQIRDINSHSLSCMTSRAKAVPVEYGIAADDLGQLKEVLQKACEECDVVLVSGGSSVGARDLTLEALQGLPEQELLAHGVSISPGKPTILARSGSVPLLGLPGQVASAQVVFSVLVRPFLLRMQGMDTGLNPEPPRPEAELARNISSRQGREDYVRVRLRRDGESLLAEPLLGPSGLLRTLLDADGLIRIPENVEGLAQGRKVSILPLE